MTEDISRDEVIERVKRGQMTPDQAEAWAAERAKLVGENFEKPFAEERTFNHYDPREDTFWSLPMAAAWIIWRTYEDVLKVAPSRGQRCKAWHKNGANSYDLYFPRDWTLSDVYVAGAQDDDAERIRRTNEALDARKKLRNQLERGGLVAFGINAEGERKEIPAVGWQDISLDNLANSVFGAKSRRLLYSDVSVPQNQVMDYFKTRDELEAQSVPPRSGFPGRPTSMSSVLNKFKERCEANLLEPTLTGEAKFLHDWLAAQKGVHLVTIKTIENKIRPFYRKAFSTPPK